MATVSIVVSAKVPPGTGFRSHANRIMRQIEAAVVLSTLEIQAASMRVVPVQTGALRGSCRTRFLHTVSTKSGWITYSKAYAIKIHEDLTIRHPNHSIHGQNYNCGGEAKYLEAPMRRLERAVIERIRSASQ